MKNSFSTLHTVLVLILLVCITGCTADAQASPKNSQFVNRFPNVSNSATSLDPNAYPAVATQSPDSASTANPSVPSITFGSNSGLDPTTTPDPTAATVSASPIPGIATPNLIPGAVASVTPTIKAVPTNFFPTLPPNETATPYVRPKGAHGETLPPEKWQEWPIIPVISDRARQIYQAGIKQGNDATHLSKIGDCQNIRQYFLGIYDDSTSYRLGSKNTYLEGTINQFSGSWHRLSEAVRSGFNVASVLTPLYANAADCKPGESPEACEIRIWNPSIVIISMETWTAGRPTDTYEGYLRQIVEYALARNILPILATKADNLEGDNSINLAVARVAAAYDIPLWNFWKAAQPLPAHGLTSDNFHLTNAPNQFDNPDSMKMGWPVRNLTALKVIDAVWKAVK